MKKYSRLVDKMILATLAAREGKSQVAAKYLAEAAEMDGFEEEVDMLDDMNNDAFEQDFGGDELVAAEEETEMEDGDGEVEEDVEVEDEVSDEEALAAALAKLHKARRLRTTASRRVVKAAEEMEDEADDEEMPSEDESEDEGQEESASLKRRRQRQLANLRQIRSRSAKKDW